MSNELGRIADYSEFNLNYDDLNNKLRIVKKENKFRRASSSRCLTGECRTFAECLDQEVEKVVLFYLRVQGLFAEKAWTLRVSQVSTLQGRHISELSERGIDKLCAEYRLLAGEVLSLLGYLDYNVIKLREIIKRHDTLFDEKIGHVYFSSRLGTGAKNSTLSQLYHQEGLRSIISSLRRGFEELYEAKFALEEGTDSFASSSKVPRITFRNKMKSFSNLEALTSRFTGTSASSVGGAARFQANKSNDSLHLLAQRQSDQSTGAKYGPMSALTNRARSVSELEPILVRLQRSADEVLRNQQKSISETIGLKDPLGVFFSVNDVSQSFDDIALNQGEEIDMEPSEGHGFLQELWSGTLGAQVKRRRYSTAASDLGLFINLMLTCIYMANIYVIAPTSGEYAKLLGMSQSMSGLIIGLQPIASVVGTLIYSLWTNKSFKPPLIACVMCSLIGSVVYGMALQCGSPAMIFIGRLLAGFGGSRGISRRYIADHVPVADRTRASSQFVMANAIGLAAGPTMSSALSALNISYMWTIGGHTIAIVRNETAGSWVMAFLWAFMLFIIVVAFKEPHKKVLLHCFIINIVFDSTSFTALFTVQKHLTYV